MESEWRTIRIGDLGRVVTGKTPLTSVTGNFGGKIPFLTPTDMDGRKTISTTFRNLTESGAASVKGSKVPAGSVLVSCIGSDMGKVVIAGRACVTNQQINSIIVDDQFSSEFVYYNLSLRKNEIRFQSASGSAQPLLNKGDFARLEMTLPPLAEQKRIAGILGALDDKIELNRKMNETLEQMARALFKSWFVDFDPVHAKAAGRQPAGMDKATADLFPDSFVDSELGKIPKGWKPGALDELVEPRAEKVAATPDKDMTRYIALEDMPSKSLDLSKYKLGSAVNSSIIRFRKGDILFGSMRVYFHKVGLACFDGITRTTTFVLKPRKERLRHFSLLHLFSDEVIAFATTASIGTTIPYVRWDSLGKYRLAIPPDELLSRFDELVGNLTSKIATQGEESRMLTDLRDSLLPRLLSGDLSLKNNDTSA